MLYLGGPSLQVWILGGDLLHSPAMLWRCPTYKKVEEHWHRCSLRAELPQAKKVEDWQGILAQSDLPQQKTDEVASCFMPLRYGIFSDLKNVPSFFFIDKLCLMGFRVAYQRWEGKRHIKVFEDHTKQIIFVNYLILSTIFQGERWYLL